MNLNRIVLINTFASGHTHEMFDYCWVKMSALIADSTEVRFLSDHIQALENIEGKKFDKIKCKSVFCINKVSRMRVAIRFFLGPLLDVWQLFYTKKSDVVIFLFNNTLALYFINFVNKLLRRRIIICCHGELESLILNQQTGGLLSRALQKSCRNFFLSSKMKISEGLHFSVIGESIKGNLESIVAPQFLKCIISVDHPYVFRNAVDFASRSKEKQTLKLGTIGGLDQAKGVDEYLMLVQIIKSKMHEVHFSHTGFSIAKEEEFIKLGVDIPQSRKVWNRREYEQRIKENDFILFFYSSQNYKITASGAIMDAIKFEIPIIALKNDYFNYLFKRFGAFGYLCNNIEEMIDIIIFRKYSLKFDFRFIKQKMSIDALSLILKDKIEILLN